MEVLTVHSQGSKEGNKVQIISSSEGIGRDLEINRQSSRLGKPLDMVVYRSTKHFFYVISFLALLTFGF